MNRKPATGIARALEAQLPPLLMIPLADPAVNADMDMRRIQIAMNDATRAEPEANVRAHVALRLGIMATALAIATAKTLIPHILPAVPGRAVIVLLLLAIIAAHGRHGEFYRASTRIWKNPGYYAVLAILAAAVLFAPPGHPTTIATTAFFAIFLAPTLYGGTICLRDIESAVTARQLKRYEQSLPKDQRRALHARLRRNLEALP